MNYPMSYYYKNREKKLAIRKKCYWKNEKDLCECGKEKVKRCKLCRSCSGKSRRKNIKFFCIDCGKEVLYYKTKRCWECHIKNPDFKLKSSIAKLGERNPAKRKEVREKISDTLRRRYKNGEIISSNKGKHLNKGIKHSEKFKENRRGDKNPAWLGGISFEPYTKEFNKRFKELIRIRDGFLCLKCGMRDEDAKILFKKCLITHHIDYIKENTFKENCCALCMRCNIEVNLNRKHWIKFFQSLLSERYCYKYSEDGLPIIQLNEFKENE